MPLILRGYGGLRQPQKHPHDGLNLNKIPAWWSMPPDIHLECCALYTHRQLRTMRTALYVCPPPSSISRSTLIAVLVPTHPPSQSLLGNNAFSCSPINVPEVHATY